MCDDLLEKLRKKSEKSIDNLVIINNLFDLLQSLYRDYENEKATVDTLTKQINAFSKEDSFGITSKYVSLKEEFDDIKLKCAEFRSKNEELNYQFIRKDQQTQALLSEKEKELKCYYEQQLEEKDTMLKQLEKQMEIDRIENERKLQQIYGELQAVETSSSVELEQLKTQTKKQLSESKERLNDTMVTCTNLRAELLSVKEQFTEYKFESKQKESELQRKIQEHVQQGVQMSGTNTDIAKMQINMRNNLISSKYQPLELRSPSISSESVYNYRKPVMYTKKDFNQINFNSPSSVSQSSRSQLVEKYSMSQLTEKQVNLNNSEAHQHFEKESKFVFSTTTKERCSTANDQSAKYHDIDLESVTSVSNISQKKQLTDNLPKLTAYEYSARSYNDKYRRNVVPPLMPLCNKSTVPKKRKLYNPDSSFVEYIADEEA